MSDTNNQDEPSMEEILASIRKIISEDDEEAPKKEAEEEPAEEVAEEPAPEPETEPEADPEDDVLELTEEVIEEDDDSAEEDEDFVIDIEEEAEAEEPEEEIALEEEPEPEPEEEPVAALAIDDVDPAEDEDVLMSDGPATDAMGQFNALSAILTSGYQGSGNTLEDLVRELLKPMLKSWLDENLPPIVERMVAKEIARLARTKKP